MKIDFLLLLIIIFLLIYLFFIVNSIIWIKNKKLKNINDIVVKYIIYGDFIIYTIIIIFCIYKLN